MNFQQIEQIWPEVAHGATLGHLEPEDDTKQSHGLYPVLSCLWRRGHTPHRPGIRVAEAQGIPRAAEPASPRRLAGSSGRGSRRGAPTLCALLAVFAKISSAESLAPRSQQRGLGAEVSTGQQRTSQARTAVGGPIHRCRSAQAWHLQAS